MGFKKDHELGKEAECLVKELFSNYECIENESNNRSELSFYDLTIQYMGRPLTLEVKFDKYATKSGNVAFEYWNPRTKKASGVMISAADIWVQALDEGIYVIKLSRLKELLNTIKPIRFVERAGDGNASIMLYKVEFLYEHFTKLTKDNVVSFLRSF